MNKRQKKKKRLETKAAQLMAEIALLIEAVLRHTNLIQELYNINSHNAKATNNRFDKLEKELEQVKTENKKLRQELKAKRSWFGRK